MGSHELPDGSTFRGHPRLFVKRTDRVAKRVTPLALGRQQRRLTQRFAHRKPSVVQLLELLRAEPLDAIEDEQLSECAQRDADVLLELGRDGGSFAADL